MSCVQVMMQTSEGPDEGGDGQGTGSPLNKLKQSLRILDDDGGPKSHKRHLSLSQQVRHNSGEDTIAPWPPYNSRPVLICNLTSCLLLSSSLPPTHTQGDTAEGANMGNAWGDYKHHLGSRPKTAHGTRMAGRSASNPLAYEFRGSSSSSRPGTAGTANYCRKCGKVRGGEGRIGKSAMEKEGVIRCRNSMRRDRPTVRADTGIDRQIVTFVCADLLTISLLWACRVCPWSHPSGDERVVEHGLWLRVDRPFDRQPRRGGGPRDDALSTDKGSDGRSDASGR